MTDRELDPDAAQRPLGPILGVLCTGLFMVWLDTTIVNVALPSIQRDLNTGITDLEWVVDAYTLAFACLMLVAGDVGDLFGRKRVFLAGVLLFTAASAACASATSIGMLHAARALQGVAGSVVMPTSLSIITASTGDPKQRARAVGVWSGVGSLGLAGGPIIGGLLIAHSGWSSVFWINVPVGLLVAAVGWRVIPSGAEVRDRRLDVVGLALFTVAVAALTFGLIEANDLGWTSPGVVAALVGAAVTAGAFGWWERRVAAPIIPLGLLRRPDFALPNLAGLVIFFGLFGVLLFMSVFLQSFVGLSAVATGLRFLPMTAAIALASPIGAALTSRRGPRLPLALGSGLAGLGLLALTNVGVDSSYLAYAGPFVLIGIGTSMAVTPGTIAVLAAAGPSRAGMASAVTQTSRQIGGVFGVAVLGAVVVGRYEHDLVGDLASVPLSDQARHAVSKVLTAGGSGVSRLSEPTRGIVLAHAGDALAGAIHAALVISAVASLLAALAVAVFMGQPAAPGAQPAVVAEAEKEGHDRASRS